MQLNRRYSDNVMRLTEMCSRASAVSTGSSVRQAQDDPERSRMGQGPDVSRGLPPGHIHWENGPPASGGPTSDCIVPPHRRFAGRASADIEIRLREHLRVPRAARVALSFAVAAARCSVVSGLRALGGRQTEVRELLRRGSERRDDVAPRSPARAGPPSRRSRRAAVTASSRLARWPRSARRGCWPGFGRPGSTSPSCTRYSRA